MKTWQEIGAELMVGTHMSTVAWKYGMSIATIKNGIERYKKTGSMAPPPPAGGKGTRRYDRRKTTESQDKTIKDLVTRKRGIPLEYGVRMVKKDIVKRGKPAVTAGKRTVQRRINEAGYGRRIPTRKDPYSPAAMKKRLKFALANEHRTKDEWERTLFLDEHTMVHANGATGSRQVHSRKRWVWAKLAKPKNGKKPRSKFCKEDKFSLLALRDDSKTVVENPSCWLVRS